MANCWKWTRTRSPDFASAASSDCHLAFTGAIRPVISGRNSDIKAKHTPDRIGDFIGLSQEFYEKNPGTLDPKWREFSNGVFRLENNLMVVLDIDSLLDLGKD